MLPPWENIKKWRLQSSINGKEKDRRRLENRYLDLYHKYYDEYDIKKDSEWWKIAKSSAKKIIILRNDSVGELALEKLSIQLRKIISQTINER
ncbi:hypothetical protein HGG64_01065 [Mycoplasma phocoeninasale]|uniref:Uncharacterized protein n=1 Tax=Mycoplasma phocoeninasale TaxID=2726117 RepID=A0A858U507_9MOLU|nr:hypothetical protein [Mycoplasma phocoeninasale]QJG66303.1 hypothetical protein HGG64_01065 [Mycoplasma phocoeninasale]